MDIPWIIREDSAEPMRGVNESPEEEVSETLHVLVVEDNLVNQKVLARQLRNLGCVVSVANHGGECLDFLRKTRHWNHDNDALHRHSHTDPHGPPAPTHSASHPHSELPLELSLILLDWEMPVMNGLTCVGKIRELERGGVLTADVKRGKGGMGRIPVIGVTANVRQQQIQMAMDAGMDDVVGKPFKVVELLGRMRELIAGRGSQLWRGKGDEEGEGQEELDKG